MRNIRIFITTHSIKLIKIASKIAEKEEISLAIILLRKKNKWRGRCRKLTPEDKDMLEKLGIEDIAQYEKAKDIVKDHVKQIEEIKQENIEKAFKTIAELIKTVA